MMPEWAKTANELLPNSDVPVQMAKCDVTAARNLGDRYDVLRYPGLIFLIKEGDKHKWYTYEGLHSSGYFMNYMMKMTSSNLEAISCDKL
jgi:hypothetical protein